MTDFTGSLTPTPSWDDVPQASDQMRLLGGPGGPLNEQAQKLANRTQYLYENQAADFCPTYAALRAYTGNATRIQIGGRTNYFDGSHGVAVRTGSRPDNDGTVWVDALGRSWERQFSGPVYLRWFGLAGDGSANDTAKVQTAIDETSIVGGELIGSNWATYAVSTLTPKSNVKFNLNGATLKLKDSTFERLFNGSVTAGRNFEVCNGTIDGNQSNNNGNVNLSGGMSFKNWNGIYFRKLSVKNVYRAVFMEEACTNIDYEDIDFIDCGQSNAYGRFTYCFELTGGSRISIKNITTSNLYGYGIHFFGCTDFEAENLTFATHTRSGNIAITFTQAKRGRVSNVVCSSVAGNNIEINATKDVEIDGVNVDSPAGYALIMGDNGTGVFNERVKISGFTATNTGGAFSLVLNYIKRCEFDLFDCDKGMDTTVAGAPANDRNNKFSDSVFAVPSVAKWFYYKKFHMQRVSFTNYYINNFDGNIATISSPQVSGSFGVAVANGGVTYVDFNGFNSMGPTGFVAGRLRVTSAFNNVQGTYHEVLFLASNNGTTLNLGTVSTVANATAKTLTIAGDAANKRISLTNGTGTDLTVYWTFDLHKADA